MPKVLAARTHPPEYMLHKYWARKPHNVLADLLRELVPTGGRVLDPFVGSGVLISEASRAGFEAYGVDVNPIAVLISRVTLDPPDPEEFAAAADRVLADFYTHCAATFATPDRSQIRYVVHEAQVECPACHLLVGGRESRQAPRGYACSGCTAKLSLSLRHLVSTRVVEVVTGSTSIESSLLEEQEARSRHPTLTPAPGYTYQFAENRRTLAYGGMETRDLFTPRNFALLTQLAETIHALSEGQVRDALLLMLSASVAQCSRLIPYRSGMTSGGPAWSVPGFWVPAVHLETNPAVHVRARLAKFTRGLAALHSHPCVAPARVSQADASTALKAFAKDGLKFDLIFLDPPYGDSVPYIEFSTLYNSFLRTVPDPVLDISVSDRTGAPDSWAGYKDRLGSALGKTRAVLADGGQLLVTFNNHDDRAWTALMAGLQDADYWCSQLMYQLPAVISAKAQFSLDGSYVGDFVAVFVPRAKSATRVRSTDPVTTALAMGAAARGGTIPYNVAKRIAIGTFVEQNLDIAALDAALKRIPEMFGVPSDGVLTLTSSALTPQKAPRLGQIARHAAVALEQVGNDCWRDLYATVCERAVAIGIPEPGEVVSALLPDFEVSGKRWSRPDAGAEPQPVASSLAASSLSTS